MLHRSTVTDERLINMAMISVESGAAMTELIHRKHLHFFT